MNYTTTVNDNISHTMEKILDTTSPQQAFDIISKLGNHAEKNKVKGNILEYLGVALLRVHPLFTKVYDTVWCKINIL